MSQDNTKCVYLLDEEIDELRNLISLEVGSGLDGFDSVEEGEAYHQTLNEIDNALKKARWVGKERIISISLFRSREIGTIYAQAIVNLANKGNKLFSSTTPLPPSKKLSTGEVDERCNIELENLKSSLKKQGVDLVNFDELAQIAFEKRGF